MVNKSEVLRKSVHLLGLLYIPALFYLGKDFMSAAVLLLTAFASFLEIIRAKKEIFPDSILREYEKRGVGGYLYTGLAFSIITPLFPLKACVIAAICAFAGDGLAGIFKKVNRKLSFPTFFTFSYILSLTLGLDWKLTSVTIIISAMFDGRKFLNDNFTIPISAAITYHFLTTLFG
ncbi:hypothetical protein Ferp_1539 [Ferroglobus placidus DSM 10642]|uniref:Phosphatidate cytidylyltransferase n=1 Tax=Ferroglobus placidus (strain DSM 10642 / AEDII12DO) TaxID=589924 RepID=D3RYX7_FERPA|nr:hypothetical protein [Ferroglobus placidus]ADC65690.1 hypothetical protein Ferp_1539 [Ferroglobus placidus DSM 10642]